MNIHPVHRRARSIGRLLIGVAAFVCASLHVETFARHFDYTAQVFGSIQSPTINPHGGMSGYAKGWTAMELGSNKGLGAMYGILGVGYRIQVNTKCNGQASGWSANVNKTAPSGSIQAISRVCPVGSDIEWTQGVIDHDS